MAAEQAHFVRVRLGVQVAEHNNRIILTGASRQSLDQGAYLIAIAVEPDLLQGADVRVGSAENITNRRQPLVPFTESPPEVPGRDLHHPVGLRPSS